MCTENIYKNQRKQLLITNQHQYRKQKANVKCKFLLLKLRIQYTESCNHF